MATFAQNITSGLVIENLTNQPVIGASVMFEKGKSVSLFLGSVSLALSRLSQVRRFRHHIVPGDSFLIPLGAKEKI